MPSLARELSALEVKRLQHAGQKSNVTFAVGGVSGLLLQITPNGARSWILRVSIAGKRKEIGLGPYPEVGLGEARAKASEIKEQLRSGVDPVAARKATKAALVAEQKRGMTFEDAATQYLAIRLKELSNPKHRQQWQSTISTYALPELGKMLVQDITVQDILRTLSQPYGPSREPFWHSATETAKRLRGRIEDILSWATVSGYRTGDNPARWAGNLKELLPAARRIAKVENQPALQLDDAPRWFAALRAREGMGSRALEFAALCASRSGEVRGARWEEIDLEAALWTIPAARMKMDREHRVPLSASALDLLKALPRFHGSDLIFPASRGGELSDATLSATMKRLHEADRADGGAGFIDRVNKRPAVPHGLRSTFRDWVAERTQYPSEMAEVALAHRISNAVEAAYRRGDMIEKRHAMMAAWTDYLTGRGRSGANVVRIK